MIGNSYRSDLFNLQINQECVAAWYRPSNGKYYGQFQDGFGEVDIREITEKQFTQFVDEQSPKKKSERGLIITVGLILLTLSVIAGLLVYSSIDKF